MYAVVSSGGKQYRVEAGATLVVDRLSAEPGAEVIFDRVLLIGDGEQVTIGTPVVEGATVLATALGEALGPKIVVFKFKQKVKYRRRTGHRQHQTRVRIDAIAASADEAKRAREPKAAKAAPEAAKAAPKAKRAAPKAASAARTATTAKPKAAKAAKTAKAAPESTTETAAPRPRKPRAKAKPAAAAEE